MIGLGELIDGRFRLEQVIGSGGMGNVYLAVDEQTNRQVAVKLLRAAIVHSIAARARLSKEIEVLSKLNSPYIAELYAAGYLPDHSPYFVMEYLDGRDLKAELRRRGPLPVAEAAAYLVQTCRGVAVAHRLGIVHRDLKPHNLILTHLDAIRKLKIVDFGVAKTLTEADQGLTASDMAVGTPLYMCPEQLIDPKAMSTRADVWALGVILYELLVGFAPFIDESPGSVVAAVTLDEPVPIRQLRPDIPVELAQLIERALVKNPSRRLASVERFEQALLPFATPEGMLRIVDDPAARPSPIVERPQRKRSDVDLRREIRTSVNEAGGFQPDTIRRMRPAGQESSSCAIERMSLVPSLKHLSSRAALQVAQSRNPRAGSSERNTVLTWLLAAPRNRTAVAASLFTLGVLVTVTFLWRWQGHRTQSEFDIMYAPSRAAPSRAKADGPVSTIPQGTLGEEPLAVSQAVPDDRSAGRSDVELEQPAKTAAGRSEFRGGVASMPVAGKKPPSRAAPLPSAVSTPTTPDISNKLVPLHL